MLATSLPVPGVSPGRGRASLWVGGAFSFDASDGAGVAVWRKGRLVERYRIRIQPRL